MLPTPAAVMGRSLVLTRLCVTALPEVLLSGVNEIVLLSMVVAKGPAVTELSTLRVSTVAVTFVSV